MTDIEKILKERADTKANKIFFSLFLALVLVFVGLRLWADARYRAVPYPNQLAVSADGVAVVCGHAVHIYSPDGVAIRTYPLPDSAQPTQLFWDKGSVCLADMESKNVLVLDAGAEGTRNFTGQRINAQFKVLRDPGTENLFVSDGANHRILVFDQSYRYLRSFGQEGAGAGSFRFPNNMAFDASGNLLIANTKRSTIDLYSPDGRYLRTVVNCENDRVYRYPTDFVVTSDRLLVLENDGFLNRGKVRIYDRAGKRVSELDLGGSRVIGALAAFGDTVYVTDSEQRELITFSSSDLHRLETFSYGFEAQCMDWSRDARLYQGISRGSLLGLLLFCAPVIIFYLKIKKEEMKETAAADLGVLAAKGDKASSADLILSVPANVQQQRRAVILVIAGFACIPAVLAVGRMVPPIVSIVVMFSALLSLVYGIRLMGTSGLFSGRMKKQTELIVKKIIRDGKLTMQPNEGVERIALAMQKKTVMELYLLVFTTKRLLLYSLSWGKVVKIEQFPFESIRAVEPPKKDFFTAKPGMRVTLTANGDNRVLNLFHIKEDYLRLLGDELTRRKGKSSGVPCAVLCTICLQPLQGDYCLRCASKIIPDWTPVLLSLLFPGLGQLRNGEMQKGLVFMILATILSLVGYLSIKAWFFEGADISLKDKAHIIYLGLLAPVLYVSNVVDAYRSGIRARKGRRT